MGREREKSKATQRRDRTAEHAELGRRAAEIPGVADVTKIYAAYQKTVTHLASLTRVSVPPSSAMAGTAR